MLLVAARAHVFAHVPCVFAPRARRQCVTRRERRGVARRGAARRPRSVPTLHIPCSPPPPPLRPRTFPYGGACSARASRCGARELPPDAPHIKRNQIQICDQTASTRAERSDAELEKKQPGKDPEPDPDASAASIGFLRKPYSKCHDRGARAAGALGHAAKRGVGRAGARAAAQRGACPRGRRNETCGVLKQAHLPGGPRVRGGDGARC